MVRLITLLPCVATGAAASTGPSGRPAEIKKGFVAASCQVFVEAGGAALDRNMGRMSSECVLASPADVQSVWFNHGG